MMHSSERYYGYSRTDINTGTSHFMSMSSSLKLYRMFLLTKCFVIYVKSDFEMFCLIVLNCQESRYSVLTNTPETSSSSDTVQGSVLLPHYRTLEVRPGRIS